MRTLKYIADKKKDGPFKIVNADQMKRELNELPSGRYDITIKKRHKKASALQFSYLYSVVYPMFLVAAWDSGYTAEDFANVDELDVWCKTQWANKPITNRHTGEVVRVPVKKSKFTTTDEMAYCDILRDYASEYLGVFIPDPDPNWREKE
jgi:hypothetical protein